MAEKQITPPKKVVVLTQPKVLEATSEAKKIARYLEEQGIETASGFLYDEHLRRRVKSREFDIMIALGGDGTMLRAGHLGGPCDIPILGINLGHFGFLIEVNQNSWQEIMHRFIAGDFWLETRMMLCAKQWRGGELVGSWDVLNEIVVSRGQIVRPVQLITYVDGRFLTTYVADGLIASTPTGSTAYALAAGGPILPPDLRNILLIPIAPHLSVERAIVLAEGSTVSIEVRTDHQAVLSVDGQAPIGLTDDDRVDAHAGDHVVKFVRFQDPGYFYRNLTSHMNQNPSTGKII
jgi:NAD+ kinase